MAPRPVFTTDQVLEAIRAQAHTVASMEDVRKHLGIGSLRTIRRHIAILEAQGLVEKNPGKFGVRLLPARTRETS